MKSVRLLSGTQVAVANGHPWVYQNQMDRTFWHDGNHKEPQPGERVTVEDSRGRFLGIGFYNPRSVIAVRLLTHRHETVDDPFISNRVREAVRFRRTWMRPDTDSYRLIFAEADRLPGLIADWFGKVLVVQILALGMEPWQDLIIETLIDEIHPEGVLLKNDDPVREKEGLPLYQKIYSGKVTEPVVIKENGLKMQVDLLKGQKTGYFLDQKANHARLRLFAPDREVLDCFCYSGGFAINAACAGAKKVTAVDLSEQAIALAQKNAEMNHLSDRITFVEANCFDYLRQAVDEHRFYDVIVLDPPAFAKSHAARQSACRGYKEINLRAFRLLLPGGILVTHSCSYHMPESLFLSTVLEAARDAHREVRILKVDRQDFDHPVLGSYPESHYLKSIWLQVIE